MAIRKGKQQLHLSFFQCTVPQSEAEGFPRDGFKSDGKRGRKCTSALRRKSWLKVRRKTWPASVRPDSGRALPALAQSRYWPRLPRVRRSDRPGGPNLSPKVPSRCFSQGRNTLAVQCRHKFYVCKCADITFTSANAQTSLAKKPNTLAVYTVSWVVRKCYWLFIGAASGLLGASVKD